MKTLIYEVKVQIFHNRKSSVRVKTRSHKFTAQTFSYNRKFYHNSFFFRPPCLRNSLLDSCFPVNL